MKRRTLIKTSTAFTLGLSLTALLKSCANPSEPQASSTESSNNDVLTVVQGGGFPNSLDLHRAGTNRPAYGISWSIYDRLMTFGTKTLPDGSVSYDYTDLQPELAESWEFAADGMSVTFALRQNATFHDGAPVTAKDVKWSFDRAIGMGGFPTFQMKAGALENPEQFVVIDDYTFQVKFLRPDKLTMVDLAVPIPIVLNSELVKQHVTDADPWGAEWVNNNDAGSGAYTVGEFEPGKKLVLKRFEDWQSGPLPAIAEVILLDVPEPGNRRALLERGDIDINFDVSDKDTQELKAIAEFTTLSHPVENAVYSIDLHSNPTLGGEPNPFGDVKVRQAIAYAVPYEEIFKTAFYSQAVPLYGATGKAVDTTWPQASPYTTDLDKAKALLAESEYADGFTTTLAFDLGNKEWAEPLAILVQEALANLKITVTLEKVPTANFRSVLTEKTRPMIINNFGGWLNFPDYFFFYAYHGQDATFNGSSYKNPQMDVLVETALKSEPGKPEYDKAVRDFISLAWEEMPRVPIVQPSLSVVMQPNIEGYQYWFHRQLDFRQIRKA